MKTLITTTMALALLSFANIQTAEANRYHGSGSYHHGHHGNWGGGYYGHAGWGMGMRGYNTGCGYSACGGCATSCCGCVTDFWGNARRY